MQLTEHILLESDDIEVLDLSTANKVYAYCNVRTRHRRRAVQLQINDYYNPLVPLHHPLTMVAEYVLDLRFVDRSVRLSRRIAWRWLLTAVVLATLSVEIALRIS